MGRVIKTTDGGGGYVSYSYQNNDVIQTLGPAATGENLKIKQLEYDGMGRLKFVCEVTAGLPGNGLCTTGGYNGYLTTYSYGLTTINTVQYPSVTVTQNAQPGGAPQQIRTYVYDRIGRLIQETNPETGTTAYTYDSTTGCTGTFNGDLVKKIDNKTPTPNITCYAYDALHRATSIIYTGPDAANTPTKTFVYDGATFNGTAMSNAKRRLVEAYTGASGSKTTDEFFSYSVRGELTDTWQCSPHSGTNGCAAVGNYYHVAAGFWANGALNTLSSGISGLASQTYGVDGMGRGYSVTASSGQNPLNSTIYDLANFKTTVTFGSLDSDVFNMDPNTGRMIKYQFTVGTTSGQNTDTGTMTWNANGSLGSLAIVDQVPGTHDTQTCSFTHDDLSRISSAGCGTNWNQNFSYDAFGNITKTATVGISFQPGYDHSKNWITSLPGSITTQTDQNGRMTYDGVHNYVWDVEGKMISVDSTTCGTNGTCTTYDALGRMIEKNASGAYTQIVYSPIGRFALMNGQTLVKAFVPLPTGATAVYTSSGLAYYRHSDHLGSSRLASTPSRTLYSSTAYAPFGEPYNQAGTTDLSFTGQDQDMVSGMHDFLMRKFVPVQGRWLSPDPAGLAASDMATPQSWNRYAYVANNPLGFTDPLGLNIDANGNCTDDDFTACVTASPGGGGGWSTCFAFCFGNLGGGVGGDGGGGLGPPSIDLGAPGPPRLPPVQPVIPQKGFCSFAADVGNASQSSKDAIQQIYNQAGVGIDFVNGNADLSITNQSLPGDTLGNDAGPDGQPSPNAIVDFNKFLPSYPVALGVVVSHEWGHWIIGCGHNPLNLSSWCGNSGLMGPGFAFGHGSPSPMMTPQYPSFQFDPSQFSAIQQKCKDLHP